MVYLTNRVMRPESVQLTSLKLPGEDALATPAVDQEVEGEVLDEVVDVVLETPAVERLQDGQAGPIGCVYRALSFGLAEPHGLAAETKLRQVALVVPVERAALIIY